MSVVHTAAVLANEEAAHGGTNPWLFGGFALVALLVALIVTMMIKVGD